MKTLRPLLIFVSLMLIVGLTGCGSKQANDNGPKAFVEPTATPRVADTAAPQEKGGKAQSFFAEEFDKPLSEDWKPFMIYDVKVSDPEAAQVQVADGKLAWNINTKALGDYLIYNAFTYKDVKLETSYDNRGVNSNGVSLICRYDANAGWYEFQVTNSGLYNIYAMQPPAGAGKEYVYNRLANGGSMAIKQGKGVNEFSATCQGNQLTLYINGEKAATAVDQKFGFGEGRVGVAVTSFNVVPVTVNMESLKVTEP